MLKNHYHYIWTSIRSWNWSCFNYLWRPFTISHHRIYI